MPGITDPTDPYFKDGQWGWDGTLWRKLPLIFGYSDRYSAELTNLNAPAATKREYFPAVDPGYIHVIQVLCARNVTTAISEIRLEVFDGSVRAIILQKLLPGANEAATWDGALVLKEGDQIGANYYNCEEGDDLITYAWGYKMKIAE